MPSWVVRKQLLYLFIVIIVVAGILFFIWTRLTAPTCFDNIQNQGEGGIDCAGPCAKQCLGEIKELNVVWSRILAVNDNQYDIVALVENPNLYLAAPSLKYKFNIYDKNNALITSKEGETFISPANTFPIFETGINFGSRTPSSVSLEFQKDIVWERLELEGPQLIVVQKKFSNLPSPRLNILVENKSFLAMQNFLVSAILYDKDKNAIGASVTEMAGLNSSKTKEAVFTWQKPFTQEPDLIEIFFKPFLP